MYSLQEFSLFIPRGAILDRSPDRIRGVGNKNSCSDLKLKLNQFQLNIYDFDIPSKLLTKNVKRIIAETNITVNNFITCKSMWSRRQIFRIIDGLEKQPKRNQRFKPRISCSRWRLSIVQKRKSCSSHLCLQVPKGSNAASCLEVLHSSL